MFNRAITQKADLMKNLTVEILDGKARFSIHTRSGSVSLKDAHIDLDGQSGFIWDISSYVADEAILTPLGECCGCEISTYTLHGWRMTLQVAESKQDKVVFLRLKIKNTGRRTKRFNRFSIIRDGLIAVGEIPEDEIRTLDGLAGAGETQVMKGSNRASPNNMLVAWKTGKGTWNGSVVAGGLKYSDFAKYVCTSRDQGDLKVSLYGEDPVGRIVKSGQTWCSNDWFYLDVGSGNPFHALEAFSEAVSIANSAKPNRYSFPTVCAWVASTPMYGSVGFMNNTSGTVKELESAEAVGFLRYSPIAVRLVPDTYDGTSCRVDDPAELGLMNDHNQYSKDRNTEQGWWDDEHWYRFGHYVEPYETSKKWAQGVRERGGIPLTYMQVGHVSYDYAKKFPGHMLGNDISELDRIFIGHNPYVTYDYTDPDFIEHMREVWSNLREAGVAGLMFDYPNQAWIENGGFEDANATTTSAYMNVFRMAKEGLGPDSWIQERNVARKVPYLDVTVGLVDSQRVWGDTDGVDPTMYRICGLRWYKTRMLYSYDTDSKNLNKIFKEGRDKLRQVLTLLYLLTGRVLLANPFSDMPKEIIYDLSRIYPEHKEPVSPRPIDLFESLDNPRVYALSFDEINTHLILFNPSRETKSQVNPLLFQEQVLGGVGLDAGKDYHAYDFWNQSYLGVIGGADNFIQILRPSEVRVIVFRPVSKHPQVVATDRHVLQGHVELSDIQWKSCSLALCGKAELVSNETMTIVVARNGFSSVPTVETVPGVLAKFYSRENENLIYLELHSAKSGSVSWAINF